MPGPSLGSSGSFFLSFFVKWGLFLKILSDRMYLQLVGCIMDRSGKTMHIECVALTGRQFNGDMCGSEFYSNGIYNYSLI